MQRSTNGSSTAQEWRNIKTSSRKYEHELPWSSSVTQNYMEFHKSHMNGKQSKRSLLWSKLFGPPLNLVRSSWLDKLEKTIRKKLPDLLRTRIIMEEVLEDE